MSHMKLHRSLVVGTWVLDPVSLPFLDWTGASGDLNLSTPSEILRSDTPPAASHRYIPRYEALPRGCLPTQRLHPEQRGRLHQAAWEARVEASNSLRPICTATPRGAPASSPEALEKPRCVVSGRGKGACRPAEDAGSENVDTQDTTVTSSAPTSGHRGRLGCAR
jgi:hypothetical protein